MFHPPDDTGVLARLALGEADALELLAARYHTRLWRYLARHLDPHTVEDVLQEIYLAVWRAASSFRGDARPSTWIYQIAHHHMATALSQRQRQEQADRLAIVDHQSTSSPEDAVADRLDLGAALRELSTKHLETLDLVYYHGFTIEETARILGVPAGTVKSRLNHARNRLHALLGKGGIS